MTGTVPSGRSDLQPSVCLRLFVSPGTHWAGHQGDAGDSVATHWRHAAPGGPGFPVAFGDVSVMVSEMSIP